MRELGFCLPNHLPQLKPTTIADFARKAEALGFNALWTIDRVVYDNLEPLTTLAAAASVTSKIRLGTSVMLLPLRDPVMAAKIIASLDVLSGGRVTLGVGIGSRPDDFAATRIPYNERGARVGEALELMKKLWGGKPVTHKGRFYQVENLAIGPAPIQKPHPPVWMGGSNPKALERVGRLADGYIAGSVGPEGFKRNWDLVQDSARRAGRDPGTIARAALVHTCVDPDKERAVQATTAALTRYYGRVLFDIEKSLAVGPPEHCVARLREYHQAGADHVIVTPVTTDPGMLDLFAQKVMPALQK
jgi:probable F420-dependent oxidoreductase